MKKILICVLFIIPGLWGKLSGQIIKTPYSMYTLEPELVNPATVYTPDKITTFFNYRNQWTDISGAPKVMSGTVYGSLINNMGLGLNIKSSSAGLFKSIATSINYAYFIKIDEERSITPGVYFGLNQNKLSLDGLTTSESSDPMLLNNNFNKFYFSVGTGFRFKSKAFTFDLAIPEIYDKISDRYFSNYLAFIAYDINIADKTWVLQPSISFRKLDNVNYSEMNLLCDYKKMLYTQVSYRTTKDNLVMLGFNYKKIGIFYLFEFSASALNNIIKNSHEIGLKYLIKTK